MLNVSDKVFFTNGAPYVTPIRSSCDTAIPSNCVDHPENSHVCVNMLLRITSSETDS